MTGSISPSPPLAASVTDDELRVLRERLNPDLTPAELRLFAIVAKRSGLDPFARQIYAIKRRGRVSFQTSIDGYRSIAARTGEYDGQDEPTFGPLIEHPYPHPEWATVRVFRKGMTRGVAATARWDEYVPGEGSDLMWRKLPFAMLSKVAEAGALRKAFPWVLADVYTSDEIEQAQGRPAAEAAAGITSARERLAARRAALAPPEPHANEPSKEGEPAPPPSFERPDELTRAAFLELAAESGVAQAEIVRVAAELFPGVASRRYSGSNWSALAERLGLRAGS